MNWKSIWKFVTPLLVGILVLNTTGVDNTTAYFQDTEAHEYSLTTAKFDLAINLLEDETVLDKLVPGDFFTDSITLTNDSDVPMNLTVDLVSTSSDANLLTDFTLSLTERDRLDVTGTPLTIPATAVATLSSPREAGELAPGGSVTYDVTVKLSETVRQNLARSTLNLQLNFTGTSLAGKDISE